MKIFIAGAKNIKNLDNIVKERLVSIYQKGFDVLVGDCYGVDSSIQEFFSDLKYSHLVVYASNGKARNNLNNWQIVNVPVSKETRGFDFYAKKDEAMAKDADYGFMIWDGKSKGTLRNIINLVAFDKKVLVYMANIKTMVVIKDFDGLNKLITNCDISTQDLYKKLCLYPSQTQP